MIPDPIAVVRHAAGRYPVYFGPGALAHLADLLARHCGDRRAAVIADDRVARLVPLPPPFEATLLPFPAGEGSKTRAEWARLTDRLLALGFGRDSVIVALGGGVTGDLAGFVAATYHRGVPLVQVPTSLLAMVDASIGGKTALDTPAGKNLVGAFHPPVAVLLDPLLLRTLPDAELANGLAEAVKHALIADAAHFAWLERAGPALSTRDPEAMAHLIQRSVAIKAAVVAGDEHERGRRAILNAGHTIAHALEAQHDYHLRHGEAVAIGLVAEARAAEALGLAASGTSQRLAHLLAALGLPTAPPPGTDPSAMRTYLRRDKKNRRGTIRCALPAGIGAIAGSEESGWTVAVPEPALLAALGCSA